MESRPANMASAGTHDKVSVAGTAVDIGALAPGGTGVRGRELKARHALIAVEGEAIRFLDDGSSPTATEGFPILENSDMLFSGNISQLKMIAQTGTATVTILWYR